MQWAAKSPAYLYPWLQEWLLKVLMEMLLLTNTSRLLRETKAVSHITIHSLNPREKSVISSNM